MRAIAILLIILASSSAATAQVDSVDLVLKLSRSEQEILDYYLKRAKASSENDPIASLEYAQKATRLAQQINNDSLRISAINYQANALLHLGNYSQALDLYLTILRYGEQKQDSATLVIAYGNIGTVYYYQQDFEDALRNYFLAVSHFPASSADSAQLLRKANLVSNMGTIYDQTKRFDEADSSYRLALSFARAIDNHESIGNILNNIGTLHRDRGDNELALKFYRDAFALRTKDNNRFGMARSCFSLGVFYFGQNMPDSAKFYLDKSIAYAKEVGALETVASAAEYAYQVNKSTGNDEAALAALELQTQINDSLFDEQTTKRIAQLETQFKFDKDQNAMRAEQRQRELYYLLAAISLILMLTIAVTLFLIQRIKTRKAQLKEAHLLLEKMQLKTDLDKKDKELATNVTFLLGKNELINNISEKLLEIKQGIPSASQTPLQKVILDVQSSLQPELWQEFEYRFQQAHETFYKILTVRFPDLTPSERRLCAFLKLNMTTKEISALTHQNAKSIDVARTRLRKKLRLTGIDQNLVTFLEHLDKESVAPDPL